MASTSRASGDEIHARLASLGTEDRAVNEKRYLKSDLEFLGVKVPVVRRQAKAWLKARPELTRAELLELTAELWNRGVHELRSFAIELAIFRLDLLREEDLPWIERWLRQARTWAHVDNIAVQLVGRLLERFPSLDRVLDRWAGDDDFWLRRAALLALLLGLRAGAGDWNRFAGFADNMLEEREVFIRKAIGWVLRETSRERPKIVYRFLRERIDRVSGLTLREGSRRLDGDLREELRRAYEER